MNLPYRPKYHSCLATQYELPGQADVIQHGFFHGDVHAGNLMIDEQGRITFLDFGICGQLEDPARDTNRRGLPALLIRRDYHAVAAAIYELGAILHPADLASAADDIATIVEPLLTRPLAEISYGDIQVEVIRIGTRLRARHAPPSEALRPGRALLHCRRSTR